MKLLPDLWCVLRWVDRKVTDWLTDWLTVELPSYEQALTAVEAEVDSLEPFDLLGGEPLDTTGYLKWGEQATEPCAGHRIEFDADRNRWACVYCSKVATMGEYAKFGPHTRASDEPPLRQQCLRCGDLFNVSHVCLRPPTSPTVPPAVGDPEEVEPSPKVPSSGIDFDDIAVPLICEVLAAHLQQGCRCTCDAALWGADTWREHVAVLIAERIENATPAAAPGDPGRAWVCWPKDAPPLPKQYFTP